MTPPPVDPVAFRAFMARWPTGVAVVTAHDGSSDYGLTVNAFLSVSLTPPTVLVSLTQDADTTPVVRRAKAFAVNFLTADQRLLSERFARAIPPDEKFRGLAVDRGSTGAPLLKETLGALECRLTQEIPVGDHLLLIGEVVDQRRGRETSPLLFFRSRYAEAAGPDRLELPPPSP
jgi:flavin reductase (DIM6/NTAB) family NADH-FMN oxidoreductase RutF